jgi:hypothetical protein
MGGLGIHGSLVQDICGMTQSFWLYCRRPARLKYSYLREQTEPNPDKLTPSIWQAVWRFRHSKLLPTRIYHSRGKLDCFVQQRPCIKWLSDEQVVRRAEQWVGGQIVAFYKLLLLLSHSRLCHYSVASGVPGGTFVSMNRFSTLCGWFAQRQGWRVKEWIWPSDQPRSAKANFWLHYQMGNRKW